MTRDDLVTALAKDAQKRATTKDSIAVRLAFMREVEAFLQSIEAAGWTIVSHEAAQAIDDSAVLDSLTRPSVEPH